MSRTVPSAPDAADAPRAASAGESDVSLPPLERRLRPRAPTPDSDQLVKHVALTDWLVLTVILLYELLATSEGQPSWPVVAAMVAFAGLSMVLRAPMLMRGQPEWRYMLRTWATAAFITFVVWETGGADSPLISLYLLPIVLAALVLPGVSLSVLVGAIAAAYVVTAWRRSGLDVTSSAFAGRFATAMGPFLIVAWLTHQLGAQVIAARRRVRLLADTDAVTGLVNLRVFTDTVRREQADADQRQIPYAILAVDIERLRLVNEQYGVGAGDAALALVANVLRRGLRDTDLAARSGGDEFLLMLSGADIEAAHSASTRIRNAVQAATLDVGSRVIRIGIAIGAAAAPRDGRDVRELIAGAERRLERDRELRRQPRAAVS